MDLEQYNTMYFILFFLFKQKTAYEMRISDGSSDVCSSDLPIVGQNKLNEVYVVGHLHVDLFELTELPDMALSNRQGYKSDDPRYEAVREYVRKELLADILRRRETYTDLLNAEKKKQKEKAQRDTEARLRASVDARSEERRVGTECVSRG